MFCIGEVNSIKHQVRYNFDYGFITPIAPERNRDVYFRFEDIAFIPVGNGRQVRSKLYSLLTHHKLNQIVVYNVDDELLHSSDARAKKLVLIEELNPDSLYRLVDENHLYNKKVNELLAKFCPERFLSNDMVHYFQCFNLQKIRILFAERYRNGMFGKSFSHTFVAFVNQEKNFDWDSDLFSMIDFSSEPRTDVVDLALVLMKNNYSICGLMTQCPWLVVEETIISALECDDIERLTNIDANLAGKIYDRLAELSNDPSILAYVARKIEKHKCLSSRKLLAILDDSALAELIRLYYADDEDSIEKTTELLQIVQPARYPETAILLGEKLLESGLPLSVWKRLKNTEKVWFVLYLSLHLSELESWEKQFEDICTFEKETAEIKNYSILAAIDFLTIALVDESEKQMQFDKGHKNLEQAIINDYKSVQRPSDELMQLICRCKSNMSRVCAARYWEKGKTAWCNAKRGSCDLFQNNAEEGIDYHKTRYVYMKECHVENALCYLSMAGLFDRIGFIPALNSIYSPVLKYRWGFEEYPYRISGRILQLNRLFSHMHCKCGKIMKSNYAYSVKIDARMAITHAYCPDAEMENNDKHDPDVYLNECWNCDEVIDSRECNFKQRKDGSYYPASQKDSQDYYVCMNCGAGVKDMLPAVCPQCGNTDQNTLEFRPISENKRRFVKCNKCSYSSKSWKSKYEVVRQSEGSVLDDFFDDELPY